MFENFPLFPEQASEMARDVDLLFFFLVAVTVFFTVFLSALVVVFAIRYRRRKEDEQGTPIHGSLLLEIGWSIIPLAIVAVMFAWGAEIFFRMNRPPQDALDISVVGKRWMWKIQHPTGQREIDELHVPVGRAVRLTLTSEDVIHSFFVPEFRMKKDAVPGRYNTAWFRATKTGRFNIFCAEYCGTEHSRMTGSVYVMTPEEYEAWLAGGPVAEDPVAAGQRLFGELNCATCHHGDTAGRGPVLVNLFGTRVTLLDGRQEVADEAYLRESILNPVAKVVRGYQPIMPTYGGQVSEEDLLQLIAYIKSLTPPKQPADGGDAPSMGKDQ